MYIALVSITCSGLGLTMITMRCYAPNLRFDLRFDLRDVRFKFQYSDSN